MHEPISEVQAEILTKYHAELVKLQWDALQRQAYIRMNDTEAREYDARRLRIGELCDILGKFKASLLNFK